MIFDFIYIIIFFPFKFLFIYYTRIYPILHEFIFKKNETKSYV
jgi:hypothetical protein